MKNSLPSYPLGYTTPVYLPVTSSIINDAWRSRPATRSRFGDPRRVAAFDWLSDRMHQHQSCTINAISDTESERKRAERFLNNKHCSVAETIENCCVAYQSPTIRDRHLLNIVDQSTIQFPSAVGRLKDQEQDMGRVGNGFQYGQNVVAGLLVGRGNYKTMGLSGLSFHSDEVKATKARDRIGRDERPLRYRSSYKWNLAIEQARLVCQNASSLLHVIDREADSLNFLLEAFGRPQSDKHQLRDDFIIRCQHDRQVLTAPPFSKQQKSTRVRTLLAEREASYCYFVEVIKDERISFSADYTKGLEQGRYVQRQLKRRGRRARLEVRFVTAYLDLEQAKKYKSDMSQKDMNALFTNNSLGQKPITFIEVREVDAQGHPIVVAKTKANKADWPINWLLMTSLPIDNLEQLAEVVSIYRMRFPLVEQLFRGCKSDGLDVESAQHKSVFALQKITAMSLKSSALVMKMIGSRSTDQGYPIEEDFTEQEVEVLELCAEKYEGTSCVQSNPYPADQLSWATWIIARMGGWKPENKQRPPGPKTLQRGLNKFYSIYQGVALIKGWE